MYSHAVITCCIMTMESPYLRSALPMPSSSRTSACFLSSYNINVQSCCNNMLYKTMESPYLRSALPMPSSSRTSPCFLSSYNINVQSCSNNMLYKTMESPYLRSALPMPSSSRTSPCFLSSYNIHVQSCCNNMLYKDHGVTIFEISFTHALHLLIPRPASCHPAILMYSHAVITCCIKTMESPYLRSALPMPSSSRTSAFFLSSCNVYVHAVTILSVEL